MPPTPKFKKDTLSPNVGNFHVNGQLKQHVVDLEVTSPIGKAKDRLDVAKGKASIIEVNQLIVKKDIKKELKLADDRVEVEEEADRARNSNTCEDSLSNSKCKDDDQVDNEYQNLVELATNMALQAKIMEQQGVQVEETSALVTKHVVG